MELKERVIEGNGTEEATWRDWPDLAHAPRLDLRQCLPASARLVVVSPHPNDEILACGGLLAFHAVRGGDCLVIAVTDGEASHPRSVVWPPTRLARARRAESDHGLAALGVSTPVQRLGLPDGRIGAHSAWLSKALDATLRSNDLVVSTWRLDGHPDHESVGHAAAASCARANCRFIEAPIWMWHWSAPGDHRIPWERLRAFDLSIDLWRRKTQALSAHRTQVLPLADDEDPALDAPMRARARRSAEFFLI